MNTKDLGNLAENIAARYLQEKGYEIIEKNYEKPWGEIDIVAIQNHTNKDDVNGDDLLLNDDDKNYSGDDLSFNSDANGDGLLLNDDGPTIIFVEVKANKANFGAGFNPELRVNRRKINKIIKTARFYMDREFNSGKEDAEWRIDIIAVTFDDENKKARIRHYKNI